MRATVVPLVLVLVAVVTACTAEEPRCGDVDCISCADAHSEVLRTLATTWSDPNVCVADSDCVWVSDGFECAENPTSFDVCPWVMHRASREAFAGAVTTAMDRVCSRIVDPCTISSLCPNEAEPRCVAFECRPVDSPCLDACTALGCNDCRARCAIASTCVAAASTCAEADSCEATEYPVWALPFDDDLRCFGSPVAVGIFDTFELVRTGDVTCGVGPDGRAYMFNSGTDQTSVGFPNCGPEFGEVIGAPFCGSSR